MELTLIHSVTCFLIWVYIMIYFYVNKYRCTYLSYGCAIIYLIDGHFDCF